ncbi:uncharacterized protein MYCFIDRAFT_217095 [Pseudocercospora fijiensis CIRAD86]|uniref:JmjC domain-containing protein n=1 Tax=Pseudocercospora fijiensis (strain CIRAD86) TaxID=383855 RepID=M2ZY28_PSEFD|nr:uncharacterized protein MYCFIDRAFT_217095 [Pseudocercospora fijiensis CIRAD86]EME77026.1 hypothetical protein MYCFIDRAFT_217095 [Pseudocercospora fijiensis CIRAD86]
MALQKSETHATLGRLISGGNSDNTIAPTLQQLIAQLQSTRPGSREAQHTRQEIILAYVRRIVQGHANLQDCAYIIETTVKEFGLDVAEIFSNVQDHNDWKEVQKLSAAQPTKDKRIRDERRAAWAAYIAVAGRWGVKALEYYVRPPGESGGRKWFEELRKAANASGSWHVARERLNRIMAARRPLAKSSQFANPHCPFGQKDLTDLANWRDNGSLVHFPHLVPSESHSYDQYGLLLPVESQQDPKSPTCKKRKLEQAPQPPKKPNNDDSETRLGSEVLAPDKDTGALNADDESASPEDLSNPPPPKKPRPDPPYAPATPGSTTKSNDDSETRLGSEVPPSLALDKDAGALNAGDDSPSPEPVSSLLQALNGHEPLSSPLPDHPLPTEKEYLDNFEECKPRLIEHLTHLASWNQHMKIHYESAIKWVSAAKRPHFGSFDSPYCEVFSVTASDFYKRLSAGFVPDRPLLLTDLAPDSDDDNNIIKEHLTTLSIAFERVESQRIGLEPRDLRHLHPSDEHESSPSLTAEIATSTFADRIRTELDSSAKCFVKDTPLNLLNLSADVESPLPLFVVHPRYNVLKTLDMCLRAGRAGKQTFYSPNDVSAARRFNLFASTLAYSRPHHDLLAGTWVKVLQGLKLWLIAVNLTPSEVDEYTQQGPDYIPPANKIRYLLLRPGQHSVLLMPPGVRVIHSPLTLSPCLMEGGMLWDKLRLVGTLELVHWTCANPLTTNESIPLQLLDTLDKLQDIVTSNPHDYTLDADDRLVSEFLHKTKKAIEKIRALGCQCTSKSSAGSY